jgi:hypothetical protein
VCFSDRDYLEVLRNFGQHAEVEAAEVAEVQRLQILRVANKLSSVFFSLTLPSLSNFQSAADLEVPRNYVQLAEVEVAEVADAEVTNSLSCRQVQQVVRCVFLTGITSTLKLSKCFRFRDTKEVSKPAEVEVAEASMLISNKILVPG